MRVVASFASKIRLSKAYFQWVPFGGVLRFISQSGHGTVVMEPPTSCLACDYHCFGYTSDLAIQIIDSCCLPRDATLFLILTCRRASSAEDVPYACSSLASHNSNQICCLV